MDFYQQLTSISGKSRFIITRGHAEENEIMKLKYQIPIESWDGQTSLVTFTDGSGCIFNRCCR